MTGKSYSLITSIAILFAIVPTSGRTAEQPPIEVQYESNRILQSREIHSNNNKPLRTSVQNEHFGVGFKNEENIVQELCKKYHHCEKGNSIPGHRFRLMHYLSNLAEAKSTSGTSFPMPEMAARDLLRLRRTPRYDDSVYERLKNDVKAIQVKGKDQVGDFDQRTEHQRIKDSLLERSTP